jgi:hypothetical protein
MSPTICSGADTAGVAEENLLGALAAAATLGEATDAGQLAVRSRMPVQPALRLAEKQSATVSLCVARSMSSAPRL